MRDRDVRLAIRAKLAAAHAGEEDTRIVEEMGVWSGTVRVDVAVINGELAGFELKSARDNLTRLPQQAFLYNDVFDRMTIVTAENHLEGCMSILPHWWGVMIAKSEASGDVRLDEFRHGTINPTLNIIQIARLLWKSEVVQVLDNHGLIAGFRSKSVEVLHNRLATEVSADCVRMEVRRCLKARGDWLRTAKAVD